MNNSTLVLLESQTWENFTFTEIQYRFLLIMVTKHLCVFNSSSLREMEHFGMLKNEKMLKVPILWHNSSSQDLNSSVFLGEKNLKLKSVRNEFFNANPLGHKYINSHISWYVEFNKNTWNFTKNTWNFMKILGIW